MNPLPPNEPHPGAWFRLSDVVREGRHANDSAVEAESIWRLRCPATFRLRVKVQAGEQAMNAQGVRDLAHAWPTSSRLRALADSATVDDFLLSPHVSRWSAGRSSPPALYAAYRRFCGLSGASPMSSRGLTLALAQRGYTRTRSHAHAAWRGIDACPF